MARLVRAIVRAITSPIASRYRDAVPLGGGTPAGAILDESGATITDEAGSTILQEA